MLFVAPPHQAVEIASLRPGYALRCLSLALLADTQPCIPLLTNGAGRRLDFGPTAAPADGQDGAADVVKNLGACMKMCVVWVVRAQMLVREHNLVCFHGCILPASAQECIARIATTYTCHVRPTFPSLPVATVEFNVVTGDVASGGWRNCRRYIVTASFAGNVCSDGALQCADMDNCARPSTLAQLLRESIMNTREADAGVAREAMLPAVPRRQESAVAVDGDRTLVVVRRRFADFGALHTELVRQLDQALGSSQGQGESWGRPAAALVDFSCSGRGSADTHFLQSPSSGTSAAALSAAGTSTAPAPAVTLTTLPCTPDVGSLTTSTVEQVCACVDGGVVGGCERKIALSSAHDSHALLTLNARSSAGSRRGA